MSTDFERIDGLCRSSARQFAEGYRANLFSPVEVVEAHLSRIRALDHRLHSYTDVYEDEARAAATASKTRFGEGRPLSALDGVPIAVKDLVEIAGKPCEAGSATRRGHVAVRTAPIVDRLLSKGAIVLGKTHTVEFALGGWGTNAHLGSPRNPWAPDVPHTAGGSSSGSAVAVAARLATLAIGTDTGGSVRVPAAFNGLVGLKTTPGRISLEGVAPLSPSLDTVGPIARTVADAAQLFLVLLDRPALCPDLLTTIERPICGMRFAVLGRAEMDQVDPEIGRAYQAKLRHLEAQGAQVAVVDLPRSLSDYQRDSEIMMAEAYANYGDLAEDPSSPMDPAVRARLLSGAIPARSYILARRRAQADGEAMLQMLEGYDALLTPTTRTLPIPLADVDESTTPSTLSRFVNQIGFCALAVPNGLSTTGLPMSFQIVCRPNDDHLAFRIGRACEAGNPVGGALPPMARLR